MDASTTPLSEEWISWLVNYNLAAGCLHFLQGTAMLICSLIVDNIRNFKLPLTLYYLTQLETESGKEYLSVASKDWGNIPIGPVVSTFFFLSAFAHFTVLYFRDSYFKGLSEGINRFRWWEYSISSSLMIVIIAQLFGMYDITSLLMHFTLNFVTQFLGLLMEEINPLPRKQLNWTPFILGCVSGFIPWIAILFYFFGSGPSKNIPSFVYAIMGSYFVLFNAFPVNMILQYAQVSWWKNYLFGEQVYIMLSLVSKTLLGWIVFGGVNQPNKYT